MLRRNKSKDRQSVGGGVGGGNTSAPGPAYMNTQQMTDYLNDLRTNRPTRPTGARPPPSSFRSIRHSIAVSSPVSDDKEVEIDTDVKARKVSHRKSSSGSYAPSLSLSFTGRPIARAPDGEDHMELWMHESGTRRLERKEARELRVALEEMDLDKGLQEEKMVFDAAQKEAGELVWRHQNPSEVNKEEHAPYAYQSPIKSTPGQDIVVKKGRSDTGVRTASGGSQGSSANSRVPSDSSMKSTTSDGSRTRQKSVQFAAAVLEKEAAPAPPKIQPQPPQQNQRKVSPSKIASAFNSAHFRNPFSRVKSVKASLTRPASCPPGETKRPYFERVEIQRNPPSQSRNAAYTTNTPTSPEIATPPLMDTADEPLKMKDGIEIRAEDIRKATSMSLKDRSPKLPTPTAVSDRPGRPIVSFEKDWKAQKEVNVREEISVSNSLSKNPFARRQMNQSTAANPSTPVNVPVINVVDSAPKRSSTMPPIPVINLPDERPHPPRKAASVPTIAVSPSVPSINVSGPSIPSINVSAPLPPSPSISVPPPPTISVSAPSIAVSPPSINITPSALSTSTSTRPLPTPSASSQPQPKPLKARPSWTTSLPNATSILCHTCALPISGRIVTAAGVRFHPSCFRCSHCSEALECVAFFPEPDQARHERIEREGIDDGMRFYCHLDFHEFFSPRCKSCKTPIEGDVVVACGAEWHAGHFFCAQCGDPFEATTPFVEKDGYAWCINCHTNRFSTKCKKCKKPVTDTVVKALGAEWHEACFCCTGCGGNFHDGRYFLRQGGEEPFCPACEERRLKA